MRKTILAVALALPLAACGSSDNRVEGWASLKDSLCSEASASYNQQDCDKVKLYDLLGEVRELQEIKDSLFANPNIPAEVVEKVNRAEAQAVIALRTYTDAVLSGAPVTDATVQASLAALVSFQQILIDLASQEGLQ